MPCFRFGDLAHLSSSGLRPLSLPVPFYLLSLCIRCIPHKNPGLITSGSKVMGAVQTFLLDAADAVVRSFNLAEPPWKLGEGRPPKVRLAPFSALFSQHSQHKTSDRSLPRFFLG